MARAPLNKVRSSASRRNPSLFHIKTGHLIEPAIKALIESRNFTALHDIFEEWTPPEIADCIVDFPSEEQAIVFRMLPQAKAAGRWKGAFQAPCLVRAGMRSVCSVGLTALEKRRNASRLPPCMHPA